MTCAATQRSVARKTKQSASFWRARSVVERRQRDVAIRESKSVRRDVAAFLTSTQQRQPMQLQVKPVRQCARRGAVDLDVTQASPLFSDHAPREVHLWQ
jgi:hypothetical protein